MWVRDLWSRWVQWFLTSDNSKYAVAFSQVGGNDIDASAGTAVPIYAFLQNGWKVKPQEANHTLNVNDWILLVEWGWDPFTNTTGSYIVRINYSQPVQAITVSTWGGGGSTAADIWSYSSRTLTESAWLSTEEHDKLFSLENSTGWGGGFINYQAINSHTTSKVNELKESLKIPDYSEKLNEINSHVQIAKEETINRIEEVENEVCSDIVRKTKEIKEDNITTRNLIRQKSDKVVKYATKQLDTMERIEKEIEDTENEIKEEFERIEVEEKELSDLFDMYDKDEEEIKAEFEKLDSNT